MKPKLSIIITSYNEKENIRCCLESLDHQEAEFPFEVFVVDSSQDNTAEIIKREFPNVKLLAYKERKFCGDGRNLGIKKAQGDIIAFLDADCTASNDWMNQILVAHKEPHMAIGGTIANQNTKSLVSWGAYFCEFSRYMPNTPASWLHNMAGANISYKREVLDRYGPFIEGTYSSDTEFHYRLTKENIRIRYTPAILVVHRSIDHCLQFIRHEFDHGRSYANVRVKFQHFSSIRRMIYTLLYFLIPIKLFMEITSRVMKNRIYISKYFKSIPFICLGLTAWCLGECFEYLGVKGREKNHQSS